MDTVNYIQWTGYSIMEKFGKKNRSPEGIF